MTSPFDAMETLFYKSVTRVTTLFAFLPSPSLWWQKQKGINKSIILL